MLPLLLMHESSYYCAMIYSPDGKGVSLLLVHLMS